MKMMITKPIPEHTEAISKICSDGWRQTVQGIYDEEYQAKNVEYWYNHKKVLNDIQNGTYTHVAIIDDQVVGTIGGVLSKEGVSEIYVFYIDETYRYQGIGSKLLDEFTAEHKKNGATVQYASVQEGNDLGIPFYLSKGFKKSDENDRYWRYI
ncbi:GNAT family N-acetyltransferase [Allobacillus halotolerans]|uniref:GNAT family N-acetyltransferase n=2 Tax=Allobacillus halotolerans TaxID=570278 RepID=A0ABS6GQR3_9BACI|nr:GNAT family N-acetyltransferase [Allobacillus halotolerans]